MSNAVWYKCKTQVQTLYLVQYTTRKNWGLTKNQTLVAGATRVWFLVTPQFLLVVYCTRYNILIAFCYKVWDRSGSDWQLIKTPSRAATRGLNQLAITDTEVSNIIILWQIDLPYRFLTVHLSILTVFRVYMTLRIHALSPPFASCHF